MIRGFMLLLGFMTVIPIPFKIEYDAKKMGESFFLFPLIGLITGGISALVFIGMNSVTQNSLIAGAMAVLTEIVLTGGLHLDGCADSADGLLSYRPKERILEIMKDSRIGTNGAIALIIAIGMKTLLISDLSWEYIIAVSVMARGCGVINAGFGKYARESGMGGAVVENTTKFKSLISFIMLICGLYFLIGINSLYLATAVLIYSIWFLRFTNKKIGGVTGDTLGAVVETAGVVALLTGVILTK